MPWNQSESGLYLPEPAARPVPNSEPLPPDPEAIQAIRESNGWRTTIGHIGPFKCVCCHFWRPSRMTNGGIWYGEETESVPLSSAKMKKHGLVCHECDKAYGEPESCQPGTEPAPT